MTLWRNIGGTAVATKRRRNITGNAVATYELINGQIANTHGGTASVAFVGAASSTSGATSLATAGTGTVGFSGAWTINTTSAATTVTFGATWNIASVTPTANAVFAGTAATTQQMAVTGTAAVTFAGSVTAAAIPVPANTVLPAIAGIAASGSTLTANTGTWSSSPTSYAYQWYDVATSAPTAATLAQYTPTVYNVSSGASYTLTFGSSVTAGHLLTLAVIQFDNVAVSTVTGGGTWTKAVSTTTSTAGRLEQWYCLSATGGTTTVTVTLASTPGSHRSTLEATEWGGTWTYGTGATTSNASASTSIATPSVTPTNAGALVIGMGVAANALAAASPAGSWNSDTDYFDNAYQVGAWSWINDSGTSAEQAVWTATTSSVFSSSVVYYTPVLTQTPTAISGATTSTHAATSTDVGKQLKVAVTATNLAGSATANSALTATVTSADLIANSSIANTTSTSNFSARVITATLAIDTTQTWAVDTLKVTVTNAATGYIVPTPISGGAPVTAGTHYTASMQAMVASGNTGIKTGACSILWYQSDGATLISTSTPSSATISSSGPTTLTEGATAPAGAAYALPQFTAGTASVSGDVVWLGNLSIIAA